MRTSWLKVHSCRPHVASYPLLVHRLVLLLHASSGPASRLQPLRFATLHLHLVGRGLSPPSCRTCSAHLLTRSRQTAPHCERWKLLRGPERSYRVPVTSEFCCPAAAACTFVNVPVRLFFRTRRSEDPGQDTTLTPGLRPARQHLVKASAGSLCPPPPVLSSTARGCGHGRAGRSGIRLSAMRGMCADLLRL